MGLTAQLWVQLAATLRNALDLGTSLDPLMFERVIPLTAGVGLNEAN